MDEYTIHTIIGLSIFALAVGVYLYITKSKDSHVRKFSVTSNKSELHKQSEHYTRYTKYPQQYYSKWDMASDHAKLQLSGVSKSLDIEHMTTECRDACSTSTDCKYFTVAKIKGKEESECHLYKNASELKKKSSNTAINNAYTEVNSYKKK